MLVDSRLLVLLCLMPRIVYIYTIISEQIHDDDDDDDIRGMKHARMSSFNKIAPLIGIWRISTEAYF